MFRKHHLKNLPEYFTSYFDTNNQIHQHNYEKRNQTF